MKNTDHLKVNPSSEQDKVKPVSLFAFGLVFVLVFFWGGGDVSSFWLVDQGFFNS